MQFKFFNQVARINSDMHVFDMVNEIGNLKGFRVVQYFLILKFKSFNQVTLINVDMHVFWYRANEIWRVYP